MPHLRRYRLRPRPYQGAPPVTGLIVLALILILALTAAARWAGGSH